MSNKTANCASERDDKRSKMVFVWKLMGISCLLAFHTTHGSLELTTTHKRIKLLSTKDFNLNCTYESKKNKVSSLVLAQIIDKGPSQGVEKELVTMDANSMIHILSPSPDVKYTGGTLGKGKAYLSAKWHRVHKGLGGIYMCRANVINSVGIIESFYRQIQVEEIETTIEAAAIQELQRFEVELRMWKEWMTLAFAVLEKATMNTFYSSWHKKKYYIAYKHATGKVDEAGTYCMVRGGYLAELNDFNEWKFVKSFMQSVALSSESIAYYYISGRRNLANNKFYWPRLGKFRNAYFNWHSGEPVETWGNYVVLARDYQWQACSTADGNESWRKGFICEMPTESKYF